MVGGGHGLRKMNIFFDSFFSGLRYSFPIA
jgi:hypothetical protein